jgi:8-oxo-dGTP diphosphatase
MDARQVFEAYERERPHNETHFRFCPVCGTAFETVVIEERPRPKCPACGFVYFRNALPAVSILVIDGDRIVLCRRTARSTLGGLWCLPCGFVEYDEDYLTAGLREVKEETGLDVEITSLISVVSNFLTPRVHSLVPVLTARPIGGELKGGDDIDLAVWHTYGEALPELAFEADGHIIERYFQTRLAGAPVDPRFKTL